MTYNPAIHHRRSIRLQGYDYSQVGWYFISICTRDRLHLFGEISNGEMILNDMGKIVSDCWLDLPNHFHGIVVFTEPNQQQKPFQQSQPMDIKQRRNMGLSKLVGRFKMVSSKQINIIRKAPGVSVWQRNYYEHIIRNEPELTASANISSITH